MKISIPFKKKKKKGKEQNVSLYIIMYVSLSPTKSPSLREVAYIIPKYIIIKYKVYKNDETLSKKLIGN